MMLVLRPATDVIIMEIDLMSPSPMTTLYSINTWSAREPIRFDRVRFLTSPAHQFGHRKTRDLPSLSPAAVPVDVGVAECHQS